MRDSPTPPWLSKFDCAIFQPGRLGNCERVIFARANLYIGCRGRRVRGIFRRRLFIRCRKENTIMPVESMMIVSIRHGLIIRNCVCDQHTHAINKSQLSSRMMLAKCARLLAASTSITAADNYAALAGRSLFANRYDFLRSSISSTDGGHQFWRLLQLVVIRAALIYHLKNCTVIANWLRITRFSHTINR